MVCLVCTRAKLPHSEELVAQLREQFPVIATILLNVNAKNTNVILGSETHPLYGPGYLEDTLCGVPVRLGPLSNSTASRPNMPSSPRTTCCWISTAAWAPSAFRW